MTDTVKGLFQDITEVDAALSNMSVLFSKADDIHKHSRPLGASCRTTFYPLDNKYSFSQKQPLESVIKKILEHAQWVQDPNIAAIQTVLSSIQKAGADKEETETGLNVADLLIRTWSLAEQADSGVERGLIIDSLRHNKAAGGGCLAGISTRLIQPYTVLVKAHLQNKLELALNLKPDYPVESDFDRAIRESLETPNTRYENDTKHSYGEEINEATAMALALKNSLQEVGNKKRADDELAQAIKLSLAAEQLKAKTKTVQAPAVQAPAVQASAPAVQASAPAPVQVPVPTVIAPVVVGYLPGFAVMDKPSESVKTDLFRMKAEKIFALAETYSGGIHNRNKSKINVEIHACCTTENEYKQILKAFREILEKKLKEDTKKYQMGELLLQPTAFKYDPKLHAVTITGPHPVI
jgi:hypothetical protein